MMQFNALQCKLVVADYIIRFLTLRCISISYFHLVNFDQIVMGLFIVSGPYCH